MAKLLLVLIVLAVLIAGCGNGPTDPTRDMWDRGTPLDSTLVKG